MLDLSKIEAGRLDIEEAPTDLAKLITDLKYVVAEAADRKGLHADDVDRRGRAAPRSCWTAGICARSCSICSATRSSSPRPARCGCSSPARTAGACASRSATPASASKPEALTEIFDAFAQTKAGAAAGGTGLGLTICDHLIRKMGGDLKVESVLGEGSRFWFTLPLVQGRETARARHPTPRRRCRRSTPGWRPGEELTALVVDDSTANRRILASLLESAGVRVITAAGGLEAIELARAHRPEVVFMDLKMSDLDGLEATRRLARDPATAAIPSSP